MLTSILPVGHGERPRLHRVQWLLLAVLHSAGTVAAAATLGLALGVIAQSIRSVDWPVDVAALRGVVLVALLYLPREMGWTRVPPLLQSTRQVPRRWALDFPRWIAAPLFGMGLGSGLYTRIVVPTFYVLIACSFLTDIAGSVAIWAVYGLTRSVNVWWLAVTAKASDPFPRSAEIMGFLARSGASMHRAHAILLGLSAIWATRSGAL